ncbi:hypothetical protein BXZ70DRAFT_907606 [Cristinia sonorae]|uniref:Integrase core domain-containing protein n=1 Tax=Cristinia sonorae TaxID=1940300 RepID=A0A8K0UNG2_9AGAR|nr:hypothetical protein BXZ70DRAFT_907606 [Cristinia sonorae]
MPNQHKALPPDDVVRPLLVKYDGYNWSVPKICERLKKELPPEYGISVSSVKRLRKRFGLKGTRQQAHTKDSILGPILEIREQYPTYGARKITDTLRLKFDIKVPEATVAALLKDIEPEAVEQRRKKRFVRRAFYAAGVNDIWAFDQHDKWKRFGLYLHAGLDVFPGRVLWCKIWWTNRQPRLITSYYLKTAQNQNGVPMITMSDLGTENYGIANCHTHIRHRLDPSLQGTRQHRWMMGTHNIKPEIWWSILRQGWTPGFEATLQEGLIHNWYDPLIVTHKLVFLWLALPWLQAEMDSWVDQFNSTQRRSVQSKGLPHGIPNDIAEHPEEYGGRDFKIIVPDNLFDEMIHDWAPPDHPVFELVPATMERIIVAHYEAMGRPQVSHRSFWGIFQELLMDVERQVANSSELTMSVATAPQSERQLVDGPQDLHPLGSEKDLSDPDDSDDSDSEENPRLAGAIAATITPSPPGTDDEDN